MKDFIEEMTNFHTKSKFKVNMIITKQQEIEFNKAINCYVS